MRLLICFCLFTATFTSFFWMTNEPTSFLL